MQHLVLRTANPTPLLQNTGWSKNGVGRYISNKFGYGLMDASALVKLARVWKTVPEQYLCTYEYKLQSPKYVFLHFQWFLLYYLLLNYMFLARGLSLGTSA